MNKKIKTIEKARLAKKTFFAFLLVFVFTLFILILSYIFPKEEIISQNLRLPIQKKIMKMAGDYAIENEELITYIGSDYQVIEGENNISMEDLNKYLEKLKSGDIFFTSSGKYLSSIFIAGKWKHSAIYIGSKKQLLESFPEESTLAKYLFPYYKDESDILIIDSSSDGVRVRKINELSNLSESSYLKSVSAFRINQSEEKILSFLYKSKRQLGKDYDYDLISEDEQQLYCSELIYHSLKEIDINIKGDSSLLAREIISPNDMVRYMIKSKDFSFIFFIEKNNSQIKELSKNELIKETLMY